jgi:dUTP pyrophosphatase
MSSKKDLILRVKTTYDKQKCEKIYTTDAGFDVRSIHNCIIKCGDIRLIHTGLYIDIPVGYEIQVRSRSGLALKHGVIVLNSPGTIDANYTGECNVILINLGDEDFIIDEGDRIAQFVLCAVPEYDIQFVTDIKKISRGGGFGHSGVK